MLTNFRTYQLAKELYKETESVEQPYSVKDQLHRAALSICLNLAEGSAKTTPKERRRLYSIALGSAREVQAIIELRGLSHLERLADQVGACTYRLVYPK